MGNDEQTAADFLKQLESDRGYQEMMAEKERKRMALVRATKEDQRSLLADLSTVGVEIETVSDLVNSSEPYPLAIPVLVRHLSDVPHRAEVREGIVRALIVPESKGVATDVLLNVFKNEKKIDFKWIVAHALVESATTESIDTIMNLLREPRHGKARGPLLAILKHRDKEEARSILGMFLNDPETRADAEEVAREI